MAYLFLILFLFLVQPAHAKDLFLLDTINVVIFGEDSTEIITLSDVNQLSLEGNPRSEKEIVRERLIYADAKKYKILPDEEAIDRHLQAVQRENNLTLEQLQQIFRSAGYSYEEGRAQFAMMTTVNSMIDFKIRSRLMVPERDVSKYYRENPIMIETAYQLQKVLVPFAPGVSQREQETTLKKMVLSPALAAGLSWGEIFIIKKSELAEDKQFITQMSVGEISEPQLVADGYELFKMVAIVPEHEQPLTERYGEISELLRRPRFEQLFQEYDQQLFDNAAIVYLHKDNTTPATSPDAAVPQATQEPS